MSEDPELETQSLLTRLIDSPKPIAKLISLFAFVLLFYLSLVLLHAGIEHEINAITHDPKALWGFIWIVVSITIISALTCAFMLRVIVQAKYKQEYRRLGQIAGQLNGAIESIHAISELRDLMEQGSYLMKDEKAQELELKVDDRIIVVSTDLFFESQEQWLQVIATNLAKTGGPKYVYYVHEEAANHQEAKHILEKLGPLLTARGVSDVDNVLRTRFNIHFLANNKFPHYIYNGFAIYRSKDSAKDVCLLYFPREQWKWNVNLLAGADDAKRKEAVRAIAEAEEQLEALCR